MIVDSIVLTSCLTVPANLSSLLLFQIYQRLLLRSAQSHTFSDLPRHSIAKNLPLHSIAKYIFQQSHVDEMMFCLPDSPIKW